MISITNTNRYVTLNSFCDKVIKSIKSHYYLLFVLAFLDHCAVKNKMCRKKIDIYSSLQTHSLTFNLKRVTRFYTVELFESSGLGWRDVFFFKSWKTIRNNLLPDKHTVDVKACHSAGC